MYNIKKTTFQNMNKCSVPQYKVVAWNEQMNNSTKHPNMNKNHETCLMGIEQTDCKQVFAVGKHAL
jgi:hypothetical protein